MLRDLPIPHLSTVNYFSAMNVSTVELSREAFNFLLVRWVFAETL